MAAKKKKAKGAKPPFDGKQYDGEKRADSLLAPVAESKEPIENKAARIGNDQKSDQNADLAQRLKRLCHRRNLQHVFNVLLVVVTFLEVVLLYQQNKQITKQSDFLERQTGDFATQTDFIRQQIVAMQEQNVELIKQGKISQQQLDLSLSERRASLYMTLDAEREGGEAPRLEPICKLKIVNAGKRPAIVSRINFTIHVLNSDQFADYLSRVAEANSGDLSSHVIPPNESLEKSNPDFINRSRLEVNEPGPKFGILAFVKYSDLEGKAGESQFLWIYDSKTKELKLDQERTFVK